MTSFLTTGASNRQKILGFLLGMLCVNLVLSLIFRFYFLMVIFIKWPVLIMILGGIAGLTVFKKSKRVPNTLTSIFLCCVLLGLSMFPPAIWETGIKDKYEKTYAQEIMPHADSVIISKVFTPGDGFTNGDAVVVHLRTNKSWEQTLNFYRNHLHDNGWVERNPIDQEFASFKKDIPSGFYFLKINLNPDPEEGNYSMMFSITDL